MDQGHPVRFAYWRPTWCALRGFWVIQAIHHVAGDQALRIGRGNQMIDAAGWPRAIVVVLGDAGQGVGNFGAVKQRVS